jgi:hypothetical protein
MMILKDSERISSLHLRECLEACRGNEVNAG